MGWRNNPAQAAVGKAIRHCAYTMTALAELLAYIEDSHPEITDCALKCGATVQAVLDVLLELHDDAWGPLPHDLAEIVYR